MVQQVVLIPGCRCPPDAPKPVFAVHSGRWVCRAAESSAGRTGAKATSPWGVARPEPMRFGQPPQPFLAALRFARAGVGSRVRAGAGSGPPAIYVCPYRFSLARRCPRSIGWCRPGTRQRGVPRTGPAVRPVVLPRHRPAARGSLPSPHPARLFVWASVTPRRAVRWAFCRASGPVLPESVAGRLRPVSGPGDPRRRGSGRGPAVRGPGRRAWRPWRGPGCTRRSRRRREGPGRGRRRRR